MLPLIQQVCRQRGGYFPLAAEVWRAAAASFAFMALRVLALPGLSLNLALDWRAIKVFPSGGAALMEFPTSPAHSRAEGARATKTETMFKRGSKKWPQTEGAGRAQPFAALPKCYCYGWKRCINIFIINFSGHSVRYLITFEGWKVLNGACKVFFFSGDQRRYIWFVEDSNCCLLCVGLPYNSIGGLQGGRIITQHFSFVFITTFCTYYQCKMRW